MIPDDLLIRINVSYRKICLFKNLTENDINDHIIQETKDQINVTLEMVGEEIRQIEESLG